jgi:hypothetical protein
MTPGATSGLYLATTYQSNCALASDAAVDSEIAAGVATKFLDLVNAIEITWALPYGIPNDRTWADIVCKTE